MATGSAAGGKEEESPAPSPKHWTEVWTPSTIYTDDGPVPPAFPLKNTGAICHFNAMLQGLASCPAAVRTARDPTHGPYLEKTKTGRALRAFLAAAPHADPGSSARVLAALWADLRDRAPEHAKVFGPGQQSASEGLTLLIQMTDAPVDLPEVDPADHAARAEIGRLRQEETARNPFAELFGSRYKTSTVCERCGVVRDVPNEPAFTIKTFHWLSPHGEGQSPIEFMWGMLRYARTVEDKECDACGQRCNAGITSQLSRVGEIIVLQRNVYGERRLIGDFPTTFPLRKPNGKIMEYRRVAVLDHGGSLKGGHFSARGLRKFSEKGTSTIGPYRLDDAAITPGTVGGPAGDDGLALMPGSYLVFYNRMTES